MVKFIENFKLDKDACWNLCLAFCLMALVLLTPDMVLAQSGTDSDPLGCFFERLRKTLTGTTGRAIATVGIVFLGIGLFLGKISWGIAIAVGLGVAAIFGSKTIIEWTSGEDFDTMDPTSCRT